MSNDRITHIVVWVYKFCCYSKLPSFLRVLADAQLLLRVYGISFRPVSRDKFDSLG